MNKTFLVAFLIGAVLVLGALGILWLVHPSADEQIQQALAGAYREGSPEFDQLTKRIIAETDGDNTWESPVGTGTIMMNVAGKLRNYNEKKITGLEVKVTVVDMDNKPVREKAVAVIPFQAKSLEPKGEIPVNIQIEGFKPDDVRARIRWKVTAIRVE